MQLAWRVACVRIPRFPIGALWCGAAIGGRRAADVGAPQLDLALAADDSSGGACRPIVPGLAAHRPPAAAHWDELPVALAEGGRLRAVTVAASRLGVRPGMDAAEARTRWATLDVLAWDDLVVGSAITTTTAALLVASRQVTPVAGAPGMWWVSAGGGGAGGERSLARTLVRVARLWHPRARVAVASSCVAARAATWGDPEPGDAQLSEGGSADASGHRPAMPPVPGTVIVPPGRCAAYLAPAPLGFIPMDDALRAELHALGLRTVGALAALGAPDVERRWGDAGVAAWRLARGDDWRRPVLPTRAATHSVSAELAVPAAAAEPLLVLVRAALDRLVRDLAAVGRGVAAVAITLTLDDGRGALPAGSIPRPPAGRTDWAAHTITREVRMARAVDRVAPLFARCRTLLERWPLSAPVGSVDVTVTATEPLSSTHGRPAQPAWQDPDAVDAALEQLQADLTAELGADVVVQPLRASGGR